MDTSKYRKMKLKIHFQSDWHIGSGLGRSGLIDDLVRRDAHNLPFVPARTLRGIWRDACEQVAYGLDMGNGTLWSQWVEFVFGSEPADSGATDPDAPQAGIFIVNVAHFPDAIHHCILGNRALQDALTYVRPGIKIDGKTETTEEDFFRMVEMSRTGTTLEAEAQLDTTSLNDEESAMAAAILIAGARLVERLGGKRRRGSGLCILNIVENAQNEAELIHLLEHGRAFPPKVSSQKPFQQPTIVMQKGTPHESWHNVSFRLRAETPLVIPHRVVGNTVETLDYIPGTLLLSFLHELLPACTKNVVQSAIQQGYLIVTNACIEIDGQRGMPAPMVLHAVKGKKRFVEQGSVLNAWNEDVKSDAASKQIRKGYLVEDSDSGHLPRFSEVTTGVELHNTIEDDHQRPDVKRGGGLYSYEYIREGSVFRFDVLFAPPLVTALNEIVPQWKADVQQQQISYRVGRGKNGEYGEAVITFISAKDTSTLGNAKHRTLNAWLLSDALIRNEKLQFESTEKELAAELRHQKIPIKRMTDSCFRHRRLDSWHVRWGFPRPTLMGLQAGSCFKFDLQDDVDDATLRMIEITGIGERRAEGFGRITFNHPLLSMTMRSLKPRERKLENGLGARSDVSPQIGQGVDIDILKTARVIEREAVRRAIARRVFEMAQKPRECFGWYVRGKESIPSLSLIGTFRSLLLSIQGNYTLENTAKHWLNRSIVKHNIDEKDRRDKKPVFEILVKYFNDPEYIWDRLHIPFNELVITNDGETELKNELWGEAVRSLVDACFHSYKRKLEQSGTSAACQEETHG